MTVLKQEDIENEILNLIRQGRPKRLTEIIAYFGLNLTSYRDLHNIDKVRKAVGKLVTQGQLFHDELNNMYFYNQRNPLPKFAWSW